MRYGTAINTLHNVLASALYKDIPDIEYETFDTSQGYEKSKELPRIKKTRRPTEDQDVEIYALFEQTWGSTALGFGGIGGQAMTSAYTTILFCSPTHEFYVYFGTRLAYAVSKPSQKFYEDIAHRNMQDVRRSGVYHIKD